MFNMAKSAKNTAKSETADTAMQNGGNIEVQATAVLDVIAKLSGEARDLTAGASAKQLEAGVAFATAVETGILDIEKDLERVALAWNASAKDRTLITLKSEFKTFALESVRKCVDYSALDDIAGSKYRAALELNRAIKADVDGQKSKTPKMPTVDADFVAKHVGVAKVAKSKTPDQQKTAAVNALVKALAAFKSAALVKAAVAKLGKSEKAALHKLVDALAA